jgi:hypothetical protein
VGISLQIKKARYFSTYEYTFPNFILEASRNHYRNERAQEIGKGTLGYFQK